MLMNTSNSEYMIAISCVTAWCIAQLTKGVLFCRAQQRINLQYLIFGQGGMPSSHSAFVSALAFSTFFYQGLSTTSIIAFALMLITLRDAMGVRLAANDHAKAINQLNKTCFPSKNFSSPLCELIGHQPKEVAIGVMIGLICAAGASLWR
ncbi:divergent PAP2 family protein [Zooshikella ganghwensis]|uniref:Divergent PAP2 family protein n=2 Tax=Zooshikella ganghwensis TaxID=202772 RepID=A0A4P9VLZ7_9GAMM|nr:divergent PAP2 family protein [Zooshikella ganghwensis]